MLLSKTVENLRYVLRRRWLNPVSRLFDLISVENTNAEEIYSAIKNSFEEKKIPLTNVLCFSSDTCNGMFGEKRGVATLLKRDLPHATTIKFSCHLIHLCASRACLKMPTSLEDLCQNIYAHFSRSTLRQKDLIYFQEFAET